MAIQANRLLTPGPQPGPNSGPAAAYIQNILALQLVHVVGGLNKIDEKMDIVIALMQAGNRGGNGPNNNKKSGAKDDDGGGIGIGEIAIGTMIGGFLQSGVTKVFNAATGVFTTLAESLTKYLSPVAIVSSAIQSNSSGYSTMGKAFQVLGTSLGMVLLPVFALVAATATTVAEKLAGELLPAMEDWYSLILDEGIPTMQKFLAACMAYVDYQKTIYEKTKDFSEQMLETEAGKAAVEAAARVYNWFQDNGEEIDDVVGRGVAVTPPLWAPYLTYKGMSGMAGEYGEHYDKRMNQLGGRSRNRSGGNSVDMERGDDGVYRPATSFAQDMSANLRSFAAEMRQSLGGGSQSTGINDIGKQIQQAALNQSPYEQKMLDWAMKALEKLDTAIAKLDKPTGQ